MREDIERNALLVLVFELILLILFVIEGNEAGVYTASVIGVISGIVGLIAHNTKRRSDNSVK